MSFLCTSYTVRFACGAALGAAVATAASRAVRAYKGNIVAEISAMVAALAAAAAAADYIDRYAQGELEKTTGRGEWAPLGPAESAQGPRIPTSSTLDVKRVAAIDRAAKHVDITESPETVAA